MKRATIILLALSMSYCTNSNSAEKDGVDLISAAQADIKDLGSKATTSIHEKASPNIHLEQFTELTDEMIGCGCSLFASEQDWKKGIYTYTDVGNMAWIKLDGNLVALDLKEYDENTSTYLYSNNEISLKNEHIRNWESTEEETTNVERLITVTKGANKLKTKLIGTCGC